ncbi:oligoendopeptidase F [Helicobacter sp. 13S00401-1]|uniref:M3 family oligoendopeptidase n=1 Tax=Helicobacter sp. 13S00401-1 TaxID=1905758 RepID=UPI000BA58D72|nr:M3 family oligoendopeptidase [Helicobacter sp. 13S00401-1]PAF51909.1 oligoendopeptidase F [Helicobacter sp. 13S00401-1]
MDLRLEFNLDSLFPNNDAASHSLEVLEVNIKGFEDRYQKQLETLDNAQFEKALNEYEGLLEGLSKVMTFAFLQYSTDTKKGSIYAKYELKCNDLQSHLIFFELEIASLPDAILQSFIDGSKNHSFYLSNLRDAKKYQLSLPEEKVLIKTSSLGASAFSRLFDELFARMKFEGVLDSKELNEEEILALLHSSERETRKKAQENFTKTLSTYAHQLTYIINMIRKDVKIFQELRGYARPESFRHVANQATEESVDALVDCVNANMSLVKEYYDIKAKLLGIELKDYDRYAPLQLNKDSKGMHMDFKEALNETLESLKAFSPLFYNIAKKAVSEGWVDSHPKEGKRGGAFSHGSVPSSHPYVLLNHTGNRRDAFTIAHEFGHMIHQELSKTQGVLNMDTPLTTAETASVFSEMLLFDKVKKKLKRKELLEIYAGKIEDIYSTLFRQIVMTNFEREIHAKDDELTSEELDSIWTKCNEGMFLGSVELTKNYSSWWSYIPHFIHSPFYCYAYSYGQLLVLALFGLYKKASDKEEFIKTYTHFLSMGGSKSPRDLVLAFGFDVNTKEFWEIGMEEVRKLLNEFKELLKQC